MKLTTTLSVLFLAVLALAHPIEQLDGLERRAPCKCPAGKKPAPQSSTPQKAAPPKKKRSLFPRVGSTGPSPQNAITLYHGTCVENVAAIMQHGLQLGSARNPGDYVYTGMGRAYLTDTFAAAEAFTLNYKTCQQGHAVITFSWTPTQGLRIKEFTDAEQENYRVNGLGGGRTFHPNLQAEITTVGPNFTPIAPRFDIVKGTMDTRLAGMENMPRQFTQYVVLTPAGLAALRPTAERGVQGGTDVGCRCIIA